MSWDHASIRECDWVPSCYYLIRHELLYLRKHHGLAGLVEHRGLLILGDLILAAKHLLKERGRVLITCWNNHALTWRSLWATRFATQPTR